jgi:hypothetical protein
MASQPLITGEQLPWYTPLKDRRPSLPYRIGRVIVRAFTGMLFGDKRFPELDVLGDFEASDFASALVKESKLPTRMVHARNLGGSTGSVCLSWCFYNGKPKIRVHNAKNIHVHAWVDRDDLLIRHASQVLLFDKDEYDQKEQRIVKNYYWFRRDWTPNADIIFHEVPYDSKVDPVWYPDESRTVIHNDGICHLLWIQNTPSEEDIDGEEDYHGLYDKMDMIDLLGSTAGKGTILNLDPTLVLKMDPDIAPRAGVRKGSENALYVGTDGGASYMEMAGSGVASGMSVLAELRRSLLEEAECVIPDPNTIAASGTSSIALKVVYTPMLSKCNIYRDQYGPPIQYLMQCMLEVARARMNKRIMLPNGTVLQETISVQPRVEHVVEEQEDGSIVTNTKLVARTPGNSSEVDLAWGEYFVATSLDKHELAGTLQVASGGKPFLSPRSATELFAKTMGNDPEEEWKRMQLAAQEAAAKENELDKDMFADVDGSMGGRVKPEDDDESTEIDSDDMSQPVLAGDMNIEDEDVNPIDGD